MIYDAFQRVYVSDRKLPFALRNYFPTWYRATNGIQSCEIDYDQGLGFFGDLEETWCWLGMTAVLFL